MFQLRSLLLPLIVLACSSSGAAFVPSDANLRLANLTGEPLSFFAIAADLAPLLDPVPEVSLADSSTRLVPSGAERPLGEISGREGAPEGGIAVYLYALTPDGTRAHFTRVQLVAGTEIQRANGRIVIVQLRL